MANERRDENQDPTKDLENVDVTELDDKDLEEASGGVYEESDSFSTGNNKNCNC